MGCGAKDGDTAMLKENKEIHIFLASSLGELKDERREIGDYISHLNVIFHARGMRFYGNKCEYLSASIPEHRMQDEYNERIRNSQYFLLLLYHKAGKYTLEEFEVAYKAFREKGFPKILTYFHETLEEEKAEDSVLEFKERLEREIGHFPSYFSHIDTVKLGLLLEIARDFSGQIEVTVQDGKVFGNGREIDEIHLDQISCYFKNETINRLRSELRDVREKYLDLKEAHLADPENEKIFSELLQVNHFKNQIEEQLHEVEMKVLKMASDVQKMTMSGEPLSMQAERAIRLFEQGECEKAIEILDDEERRRKTKKLEEKNKPMEMEFQMQVTEIAIKAGCLSTMGVSREREREIVDLYEEASSLTLKHNLDENILYAYLEFLVKQNQIQKAVKFGERVRYWLMGNEREWNVKFYLSLMTVYCNLGDYQKAEKILQEILGQIEIESKKHDEMWKNNCQMDAYELAGELYWAMKQYKKAKEYTERALEIYFLQESEKFSDTQMAEHYVSLAGILTGMGDYPGAMQYYRKILDSYSSEEEFELISQTWNNLGDLYLDMHDYGQALNCFFIALDIVEKKAVENPGKYEHGISVASLNVAKAYGMLEQNEEGLKYCLKALEMRRKIDRYYPNRKFLASAYNSLSVLYYGMKNYEKSRQNAKKAFKVFHGVPEKEMEVYREEIATIYGNYANACFGEEQFGKAEIYYKKSIEMLRGLMQEGAGKHEQTLVVNCFNLGELYVRTNEKERAAASFEEALVYYTDLQQRGVGCKMEKAMCHRYLGTLYFQKGEFQLSKKHFEQACILFEQLDRIEYDTILESIQSRLQMLGNIL